MWGEGSEWGERWFRQDGGWWWVEWFWVADGDEVGRWEWHDAGGYGVGWTYNTGTAWWVVADR